MYFTDENDVISVAGIIGIIVQLMVLIFASYAYSNERQYKIYYASQLLCTWIVMLNGIIPYASRIKYIFGLPTIILLPYAIKNLRDRDKKRLFYLGLLIAFTSYAFVVVYVTKSYGVLPYNSIFNR